MNDLKPYFIDPNEFSEHSDDDFINSANEIVSIYLVKKDDHIYVKKDFDFTENEEGEEEEDTSKSHEYSKKEEYKSKSHEYSDEDDYSSDIKNPLKYFKREVRHLYDVQIEGYPFLRFIGFNYRTKDSTPFIITEYMKGKTLGVNDI